MAEQQVIIDLISDSEEENEGPNASSSFSANAASGQGGGPAAAGSRPPAAAKEEKPCSSSSGGGGGRGGSSGGGASGGSVGAPLAPPHAPPTANDAAGGESGRPRPPSPPASQAAHVLSSPSGAAAAGGGEDAPPAPEELKDGLRVWVLNVNKKPQPHGVNTWPARVCEEGGRWVREVRPPPEGDRAHFARLVAKCQGGGGGGGGEPLRLVYLYEGRAHHYHAVPRGALRRFRHPRDPPARADALPPPGRKKLNYAVYYFCEENGLPPEEYVGDYKPPLADEEDGGGEGEGSETDSMELRSELIKSLDALEHQIQGVTFQNFFPLVRSLNGALRCSGCLLDNMDVEQDYLSVHNLLKILEGFEKLLKFVEERTKDNNHNKMMEKLYRDSIGVLMKENGLTSFSQGQKKFEMLGEQTLGFLMHHCLIFAEMREDLKNIDMEILKTKVCLLQHIQVLADHFKLWQDKCSKLYPLITPHTHKSTAAEGYKPIRGSLAAPAESALALARRSPYEIDFCVYCLDAGIGRHYICDGCPATYCKPSNRSNKSCLKILRKKGIHDSNSQEFINSQGRLLHDLWLCPLCCQSLQLFQAVEDNNFGKVLEMTDRLQGNFLCRHRLFSGSTALHVAAAQNNCQMIELLLQPIRKGILEGLRSEKADNDDDEADVSKWKAADDNYWWKMPIRCLPVLHSPKRDNPFETAEVHKAVEARLALGTCYRGGPPPPRPRRPRGALYRRSDRIWQSGGAGRGALRCHWASLRAAAAPLELGCRGAPLPLNGTAPAAERAAAAAAARGAARSGGGGAGTREEEEELEYALFGEDVTGGRAPAPVPWVNELDDERPDGFVYLLQSVQREGVGPDWNLAPDPCTDRKPPRRGGGGGSVALEEDGPPTGEVPGARKGKKRPRPTTPPPGPAGAEGGEESPPPPGGCALVECRRARDPADQGGCHRLRGALRGMVECNYLCPCGPARNPVVWRAPAFAGRCEAAPCGNRELLGLANGGHNPALRLLVFKTRRKGWGLRTLEDIPKGTFVCAYAGEVVAASEGLARERRYHTEGRPVYIMNLHGTLGKEGGQFYMVDSTEYRNIGALANHTCGAGALEWRKVWGDHLDSRLPAVGLYAARDVQAGEELDFKYDSIGRNNKPDPCYCNHCGWDYH